jgi:hypothetical protein
MKGGELWFLVVVVGVLVYWWFGVHVKATVTVPVEEVVIRDRAVVPPASGDAWAPAELGFLNLVAQNQPT